MYCRNCGNQIGEQDSFCSHCGHSTTPANVDGGSQYEKDHSAEEILPDADFKEAFVGKNYPYFFNKWSKIKEKDRKRGWNWAIFFLGPFWFGYRKMYLYVAYFAIIYFLIDLFLYLMEYQFSEENYYFDSTVNFLVFPVSIFFAMFGNYFYLKHTNRNIEKVNLMPFTDEQKKTWLKRKGGRSWGGVFISLLILFGYGITTALLLPTNVDQILTIKNGSFYEYPTTTIGEEFDKFFTDPHWEYVTSDTPYDVVRFTGIADREGDDVEVMIDFIITDDSFDIHSGKVNGEKMSEDDIGYLIEAVFTSNDDEIIN
ncbi:DUF2628 domain-containing protein [Bacillus sp. FJAT-29814]|uniref:DUF2628 domain-containing protein n=1 Tax=Bacillus sp. FJAT-29814 TaxID=1729688 RepID=UPI000832C7B9|nr:DUF2628 domain-containing protein [Bacillus sp. FJAT-29814]